ncbi:MAG: ABC transporter permease subunit [Planctomycetota bacterium]|nr:ABC transporter permease subunit [Planctomycetota bacterium]
MKTPRFDPLFALAIAALALLGLAPLGIMGWRLGVAPEALQVLEDPRVMSLLGRTLALGLSVAAIAGLVGAPFGFLVARTNLPLGKLLGALGLLPFLIPPLFLATTWTQVWDLRGAPMTALLIGLSNTPIVALFTAKAAGRIDARREEAALLAGGRPAVFAMTWPLIAPAVMAGCAFAFLFAIHDFALPDYVSSVGPKFNVFADEVFAVWVVDQNAPEAVATAIPLVLLTLAALLPALLLMRRGSMATIEGNFEAPKPMDLGAARWPAFLFCGAFVVAGAGVPLGRLFWEAGGGPQGWSLPAMKEAFALAIELGRSDIFHSILFAVAAASLALPLALALGHRAERGGFIARFGLPLTVLLPLAVPAILYGIGTILLWNRGGVFEWIYGSGALVVMMIIGRFLCFPTLVCQSGVAALDPELEEAAKLAGASPMRRLLQIVAPPLWPSLAGSWTLIFILAVRELDAAVIVPAAKQTAMYRVFNAVHFGHSNYVAALSLLVIFVVILPGLLWALFSNRRMEILP